MQPHLFLNLMTWNHSIRIDRQPSSCQRTLTLNFNTQIAESCTDSTCSWLVLSSPASGPTSQVGKVEIPLSPLAVNIFKLFQIMSSIKNYVCILYLEDEFLILALSFSLWECRGKIILPICIYGQTPPLCERNHVQRQELSSALQSC